MADKPNSSAADTKTPASRSSSAHFWLKIFVVVQLVLLAVEFSPDLSTNGDDAFYYLLGKSLFSGNGYRDVYNPANPVQSQYPPLFPALLGLADSFSHSPLLPKIIVGLLSAGILLLLFYYLRPLQGGLLLPLLLMVALSSSLASHATLLMSEVPYLFASLAALLLFDLLKKRGGTGALFWCAALVAIMPVFIRTVGLAFSAAWITAAILDKKYKQALAYSLLFAGAMVLLRYATEWNSPYIDVLFRKNQYDPELGSVGAGEMFSRIGYNLNLYLFSVIPQTLLDPELDKNASLIASFPLLVPLLIGWIRNFWLPTGIISYYLFFYMVIICMGQSQWSSSRFIIPLVPFLLLMLFLGLEFIVRQALRLRTGAVKPVALARMTLPVLWTAALVICVFNCNGHLRLIKSAGMTSDDWKNFYSCADWLRLNSPGDAIVVTRKPELFYLRSQRKGFVYPFSHDVEKIIDSFKKGNVRYCVLDNFFWTNTSVRYLFPAITSHPEMFRVVYSLRNPDTYVMEFTAK